VGPSVRRYVGTAVTALLLLGALPGAAQASPPVLRITADTILTADVVGPVVIAKDGVTLDCRWHRILGNGVAKGITVEGRTGVTVSKCDVSGFQDGLWIASTTDSLFELIVSHDNVAPGGGWSTGAGIWVQSSSGNKFIQDVLDKNSCDGLDLFNSSDNLIVVDARDNGCAGVFIGNGSDRNHVVAGSADRNGYDGYVIADGEANLLEGNAARDNVGDGFGLGARHLTADNVLAGNTATGNGLRGFFLNTDTVRTRVAGNTSTGNGRGGFLLVGAAYNTLTGNNGSSNGYFGFAVLSESSHNLLEANSACGNPFADGASDGTGTGNVWTNNSFCTTYGF
jgi:parallel beta-helix repeat protein